MPYILNKTNGTALITVDDAKIDTSTDLTFVGRNYAGYGEIVNENFLKLLENFSNTTPPPKPLIGQLWFDSTNKKINICYDGKNFKAIPNIAVTDTRPQTAVEGDIWWDSSNDQLKVYDGAQFLTIGPAASTRSAWESDEITVSPSSSTIPILKSTFGRTPIAVISDEEFSPEVNSELKESGFDIVKQGMTLAGADETTGSSKNSGYYLWGTAAEALVANVATTVVVSTTALNSNFYVPFVGSIGPSQFNTSTNFYFNPSTNVLNTVATSAQYADLAERYASDQVYEVGTVVVIGGEKDITVTHTHADTTVAGIISQHPAYRMNSGAGVDETHPYVALRGRVPCKVIGSVKKGALLVTSSYPGYAEVFKAGDSPNAVIGKALQSFDGVKGVIEVLV